MLGSGNPVIVRQLESFVESPSLSAPATMGDLVHTEGSYP